MDDVKSTATNVHELVQLQAVQWTVFCAVAPTTPGGSGQIVISFQKLQEAIRDFRHHGHHVYHRPPEAVLWLFTLSSAPADGPLDTEPSLKLARQYGLQALITGSLQAPEGDEAFKTIIHRVLGAGTKRKGEFGYPDEWRRNAATRRAFLNAENVLRSSRIKDPLNAASVYFVFIAAVGYTLSTSLAKLGKFIPLSAYAAEGYRPKRIFRESRLSANGFTHLPKKEFALSVVWVPDGALLLLASDNHDPQESSTFSRSQCRSTLLTIAPYGWTGEVIGKNDNGKWMTDECSSLTRDQYNRVASIPREDSKNLLSHEGFEVSKYTRWNKLVMPPISVDSTHMFLIEWPDLLCIPECEREIRPARLTQLTDPGRDPLLGAENWYLERETRKEVIKSEQHASATVQVSHQSKSTEQEDENLDLNAKKNIQDLQNAVGVYPTPPDGHTGINTQPHMASAEEDDQPKGSRSDADSLMDHDLRLERYDRFDDDGLLEELGRTMDSNNGITEADFNFFDEPDDADLRMDLENESPEAQGISAIPNRSNLGGEATRLGEAPSAETTSAQSPSPEATIREAVAVTKSISADTAKAEARTKPGAGETMDQSTEDMRVSSARRGKAPATIATSLKPLDLKYLPNGKFAPADTTGPVLSGRPGDIVPKVENSIPRLGDVFKQNSDEDWSDSESLRSSLDPLSFERRDNSHKSTNVASHETQGGANHHQYVPGPIRPVLSPQSSSQEAFNPLALIELLTNADRLRLERLSGSAPNNSHSIDLTDERKRAYLARIVVEQAISHESLRQPPASVSGFQADNLATVLRDPLATILPSMFPKSLRCDLVNCASLGGEPTPKPITRTSSSTLSKDSDSSQRGNNLGPPGSIKYLLAPDFRVRRGGVTIDLTPTALGFWEGLGLSPKVGEKDVLAVCLCTQAPDMVRGATSLLQSVRHTYQTLGLGRFQVGDARLGAFASGLACYSPHATPEEKHLDVDDVCARLGRALQSAAGLDTTPVVHIISQSDTRSALPFECDLFWRILKAWEVGRKPESRNINLQVIPGSWVRSNHSIPLQPPNRYIQLANIIYDRIDSPQSDLVPQPSAYVTASLFELAPSVSGRPDLRLSTAAVPAILEHSSVVHIAYAWQPGMRWLSAAITDDLGCHEWKPVYYVGQPLNPWYVFREIAADVWGAALELMGVGRTNFSVVIAKESRISDTEVKVWSTLLPRFEPILVRVDGHPPVQPLASTSPAPGPDPDQALTPLPSTPEVASPDVSGTRGAEDDMNGRLVDKRNEYHFLVANKILADGELGVELRDAVACGYLIRGGGEAVIGIEVVHADRACDFKEVVGSLHGLCVLARARSAVGELPWHLAVVKEASKALEHLD